MMGNNALNWCHTPLKKIKKTSMDEYERAITEIAMAK
jgi:hypothetical protein